MNKESCSSLVFIKLANGESFGVCVCVYGEGEVKSWGDCVELAARRMGVFPKELNNIDHHMMHILV